MKSEGQQTDFVTVNEKPHVVGHPRGWAYLYCGVVGIGATIAMAQANWLWRYEMYVEAGNTRPNGWR